MKTGAKILLGCGLAIVLAAGAAAMLLVGGVYWAKGKAEKYVSAAASKAEEIARYEKDVARHSFEAPADGSVTEPQLVKFLDVRRQIHAVYEQHKPDFESLAARTKGRQDLGPLETVEAGTLMAKLFGDVRLVQLKALSAARMGEEEYRYVQQAVYASWWARELEKDGAPQPSEQLRAMVNAGGAVVPGGKSALEDLAKRAQSIEVPQGNVDLFRRYEADIKKYAMTGLAAIGL